jgi:carboxylesterase type B
LKIAEMNLVKINQANAAIICQDIGLEEQAIALLQNNPTPADYIQQLIAHKLYPDAVRFLAHALPKREATWWACLCARNGLTNNSSVNEIKAIELAEAWVYKPTEENSKLTLSAAQSVSAKMPASWAAFAAFWSGDNISPTPHAIVPPDDKLYAKAVIGAVMLASAQGGASGMNERYELFLRQALNIASGGDGRGA